MTKKFSLRPNGPSIFMILPTKPYVCRYFATPRLDQNRFIHSRAELFFGIQPTFRSCDTLRTENPIKIFGLGGTALKFAFLVDRNWDYLVFTLNITSLRQYEYTYWFDLCESLDRDVWIVTVTLNMPVGRHNGVVSIRWCDNSATYWGEIEAALDLSRKRVATLTWTSLCRILAKECRSLLFYCRQHESNFIEKGSREENLMPVYQNSRVVLVGINCDTKKEARYR